MIDTPPSLRDARTPTTSRYTTILDVIPDGRERARIAE